MLQAEQDLVLHSFELPPWPALLLAMPPPELGDVVMISKVTFKMVHHRSPHPPKRTRLPWLDVTEVNGVAISTPLEP